MMGGHSSRSAPAARFGLFDARTSLALDEAILAMEAARTNAAYWAARARKAKLERLAAAIAGLSARLRGAK